MLKINHTIQYKIKLFTEIPMFFLGKKVSFLKGANPFCFVENISQRQAIFAIHC